MTACLRCAISRLARSAPYSTVLLGADRAKREIAQRRQAVIVEGYTDVMACHLAGVPTAVATCGTSSVRITSRCCAG